MTEAMGQLGSVCALGSCLVVPDWVAFLGLLALFCVGWAVAWWGLIKLTDQ